jgi:hypothetical protein
MYGDDFKILKRVTGPTTLKQMAERLDVEEQIQVLQELCRMVSRYTKLAFFHSEITS